MQRMLCVAIKKDVWEERGRKMELRHCPGCNQMTNHKGLNCLKCNKGGALVDGMIENEEGNIELINPVCQVCGKQMKQGYDEIAKKKSKHLWDYDCECNGDAQLMIG